MRRLLLIFALLSAPAFGQVPPPPTPPLVVAKAVAASKATYPSGSVVYVDATGSTTSWPLQFQVVGRPSEPKATLDGGNGVIYPALPDGVYFVAVSASVPVEGKPPAIDTAVVAVTIGPPPAPAPDPTPGPPIPPPVPPAFTGKIHATLVFDVDEPSTAQLRASTVKADLKTLNADWYVAPTAGAVAGMFARFTSADGLPTIYFTDDAGKMLGVPLKAPTSKDQVTARIKAIRGGN